VHRDGRILMQKRRDNGLWSVCHGGAIEVGETVEETAKRELSEETGLVANTLNLFGVYSGADMFHTYPNGDKVYNISVFYSCDDFNGELLLQAEEILELRWFETDSLPEVAEFAGARAFRDFVQKIKDTRGQPCLTSR